MCRMCQEAGVPLVPYGTGTGLEGGTLALRGGIALNLTRMDQVGGGWRSHGLSEKPVGGEWWWRKR